MSECVSRWPPFRLAVKEECIFHWPGAFIVTQAAERASLASYFNSLPVAAPRFPNFRVVGKTHGWHSNFPLVLM